MRYGKHWESEKTEMEMASIRPSRTGSAHLSLLSVLGDGTSRIGRGHLSMKIGEKTQDRLGWLLVILLLAILLFIIGGGMMVATEF